MTTPISNHVFRDALAHFASGVTIVTAEGPDGPAGFTATGFTSVSLDPPLILVCVGHRASVYDVIVGAPAFGVSILSEEQAWIAQQFARKGADRFDGVRLSGARVPFIHGALAHLECRQHARHDAGDHTILIGEVLEGAVSPSTGALSSEARPLLHYARRFGGFHDG